MIGARIERPFDIDVARGRAEKIIGVDGGFGAVAKLNFRRVEFHTEINFRLAIFRDLELLVKIKRWVLKRVITGHCLSR